MQLKVDPLPKRMSQLAQKRRLDWFQVLAYTVITVFALLCVLPFWLLISGSITDENELIRAGYALWPHTISFRAYQFIFSGNNQVVTSYGVSILITCVGTLLALFVTTTLAYSIANRKNRLSRPLGFFVYFPMLFSGGLVPFYLLVTQGLQLSDSLWAVILPLLVNPFFVFVMVSFFRKIPQEIVESGRIDGASEATIFFRLVVPISMPILATIGLFYALAYWNDWFMALLFLSDQSKFPLQLLLQNLIANVDASQSFQSSPVVQVPSYQLRMALTLLTVGPIIFLYPFLQRYFVRGLTLGSAKG
jgi:putative aldouronate transport system permease protein